MDDYAVGRFKAFYNFIFYGYGRMDYVQMVNSSCRNNQEQEDGYNAGIAEIAFNRKCIEAYIERRTTERYLEAREKREETEETMLLVSNYEDYRTGFLKACMNYFIYDLERTIERKEKDCSNEGEKIGYADATLDIARYHKKIDEFVREIRRRIYT